MDRSRLHMLLTKISDARIAIVGDFCLDAYFMLNSSASERSLETGLPTRPVRTQRYSLGGAGNVAHNLWALGVGRIIVFGVIGHDPFGKQMKELLEEKRIDTHGLLIQETDWDTHVYAKPYEKNREENRIDFGNFNQLQAGTATLLLEKLTTALEEVDLVVVNEQVMKGIHTTDFREALAGVIRRHPETPFVVDSRHYSDAFDGAIRKVNVREALRLCGNDDASAEWMSVEEVRSIGQDLYERWQKPLFLTRGEHGCLVFDDRGNTEVPGLLIVSPVDPVGAGDSTLAGIASALAVGETPLVAAELGGFVAGVTVQKLFQTGTASPAEVLQIGSDPDYRYQPDLARQPHKAAYHPQSSIEIVTSPPSGRAFTHCIFDQDGTLSTLRQGWEEIMEPMMVKAILGSQAPTVDDVLYHQVLDSVREYIDKTTGVQTLVQMKGLSDLVRHFGLVPEEDVLDEFGYKDIYDRALLGMVTDRIAQLKRGELSTDDYTIKNALPLLHALHERGVRLYLASGTDQGHVVREAEILGYGHLFEDRMYGSVGDITKDAKKIVLERILATIGDHAREGILTFGDGPVEIRETHKRGGFTVGVASNEVRRHGLNINKRRRLIEAGADFVVPDFSQMKTLLQLLFTE